MRGTSLRKNWMKTENNSAPKVFGLRKRVRVNNFGKSLSQMLTQDKNKKELLLKLGRKIYEGLKEEKILLDVSDEDQDFKTEIERVRTLIDYVKNKQNK
jgi:hypothetical protein